MMDDKQDDAQTLSNLEFSRRKFMQALNTCSFENKARLYLLDLTAKSKETKIDNNNSVKQKYDFRMRTKTKGFYDENVEPIIYDRKINSSEIIGKYKLGAHLSDFNHFPDTQCGENYGFDNIDGLHSSKDNLLAPIGKTEHNQWSLGTFPVDKDSCPSKFPITKRLSRCSTCGKGFCRWRDLHIHVSSRHEGDQHVDFKTKSQRKVEKLFKCLHCSKGFCRLNDLHSHAVHHDNVPNAGINRLKSNNRQVTGKGVGDKMLKGGNKYHMTGKLFECLKCHKGFCRQDDLSSHEAQQHHNVPEKAGNKIDMRKTGNIFKCFHCGKRFCKRKNFIGHLRNTGNRNLGMNRNLFGGLKLDSGTTGKGRFKISSVNNKIKATTKLLTKDCCFSKKKYKSNMVNMWMPNLNFKCKTCSRNFKYRDFRKHLKIHNNEKPFQCTRCGKEFQTIGNFNIHLRVHTDFRPYACPSCPLRFRQLGQVQSHFKLHSNGKGIQCKKCGALFGRAIWMKDHACVGTDK